MRYACAAAALRIIPHRLNKSEDLVLLGEKDVYEPLCRDCYLKAVAEESE